MSEVRDVGILAEEVTEFAEKHQGENFYMLRTDLVSFGFLYVGTGVCTLGWQGTFMFSRLDEEVLTELPSSIIGTRIERMPIDKVSVSLILQEHELVEYDLTVEGQYDQYRHAIDVPDIISFARYDAEYYLPRLDRPEQRLVPIRYAFTAENPQWLSGESELTILLPRWEQWPESLLDWVMRHHMNADILQKTLDLGAFSATIAVLARSNQPA